MGVTIHYRGQLADVGKIKTLCDELTQVAEKMDWAYSRLDEDGSRPGDTRLEHDERSARIVGLPQAPSEMRRDVVLFNSLQSLPP